ncbi:unnamed protein product [Paramecium sonneborni]|uniref:Uncharacterized protein n=1 Tax=Paramecium sonneborni TaxID=65129 RepID=A0A8S1RRA1_9CILI|nr:unnamed protein product [Paramecium sonneborni]
MECRSISIINITTIYNISNLTNILKKDLNKIKEKILYQLIKKQKLKEEMSIETNFDEKQLNQYQQFYLNDHKKFQIKNLCFILGSFFINQTIILMRSNKYNNSIIGLNKCTLENNMILFAIVGVNIAYSLIVYWNKRNEEYHKDIVQYRPNQRIFKQKKLFLFYYLGGFLAGFSTGFLGMSGGIIIVTFLLSQKIIAREAAATAAFGSFMISINSLFLFILQKSISDTQMIVFIIFGILGVIIITKPSYILMNKFRIYHFNCRYNLSFYQCIFNFSLNCSQFNIVWIQCNVRSRSQLLKFVIILLLLSYQFLYLNNLLFF